MSTRDSEATVWVRVVCFGKLEEQLARHGKGDTIAAAGRLELSKWTDASGTERESWNLTADSLVLARTVRPGDGKRRQARETAALFNDDLPGFRRFFAKAHIAGDFDRVFSLANAHDT